MFNADQERYERENRMHPPETPPGQEDIFSGGISNDGLFGSNATSQSMPVDTSGMGGLFDNPIGGFNGGGFSSPMGGGMQPGMNSFGVGNPMGGMQQQQPLSDEEKIYKAVGAVGKGSVNIIKDVAQSVKGCTPLFWNALFMRAMFIGAGAGVLGLILGVAGLHSGWQMCLGGLLSCATYLVAFGLTYNSGQKYTSYFDASAIQQQAPVQSYQPEPVQQFSAPEPSFNFDSDDSDEPEYVEEEEEDDDWLSDAQNDEPVEQPQDGMDKEEALSKLTDVPSGLYTRQYLFDAFMQVLPTITPGFAKVTEVDEDSDEFMEWSHDLREAAEVAGSKEENLPEVLSVKKSLVSVQITCDRPSGFNAEKVAAELANLYAYKPENKERLASIYSKYDTSGKTCYITIFTGKTAMVSLKDMMNVKKDFFLDSRKYLPVCVGIDQENDVKVVDLKKIESVIITGMPRSGKSWFVQAILTQMCAFVSPKELHFYICDPKEGISDFRAFKLPHVKKFVSEDAKILDTLRYVVKVEAPRRKKIIGDAGFVNIWDYKERNPDVNIPIIYIVVDEIVTLASRMDKDTNNEFRMLLRELISQLPALGIRAFLIPHVLNNDIIEKKTSDLVQCRVSVRGDADHIEKATGAKPKDFPYKLTHQGEMAARITEISAATMFLRGPVLTTSNNENQALFEYMRKVWKKLEPVESSDSVAMEAQKEEEMNDILRSGVADDELDLFDDNEEPVESVKSGKSSGDKAVDDFFNSFLG